MALMRMSESVLRITLICLCFGRVFMSESEPTEESNWKTYAKYAAAGVVGGAAVLGGAAVALPALGIGGGAAVVGALQPLSNDIASRIFFTLTSTGTTGLAGVTKVVLGAIGGGVTMKAMKDRDSKNKDNDQK